MYLTSLCDTQIIVLFCVLLSLAILGHYLKSRLWGEKRTGELEKTVMASVTAKEVKSGTQRSGRSKGGYSYVVNFLTEDGQRLELYAHEIEFGGLKEGVHGLLTFQGRYFVSFEER